MTEATRNGLVPNELHPLSINENAMSHALNYSADAVRALTQCQSKYAAFVSDRLAEDIAMPSRLAECKSPMEVIDVWADFYRTAMDQYATHAKNMTERGQQAMEEAVLEVELEVEDLAETAERTLKAVEGKTGSATIAA